MTDHCARTIQPNYTMNKNKILVLYEILWVVKFEFATGKVNHVNKIPGVSINSPLKIYYMSQAALAANSMSSLTSLSFNLLFGLMPDTQINRSSK
jgi:hypothetical protein